MTTRLPTKTFWPNEHRAPMRAPPETCTQCHTRVPSPICAPSSTMAVAWICAAISVLQRERDTSPVARRQVGGDQDLERSEALAAVRLRVRLAAQGLDHVVVVQ